MDVMVCCVIPEEHVEYVPWKPQTAMIIDTFHGGEGEEEDGRSRCHPWYNEGQGSSESVQDEPL